MFSVCDYLTILPHVPNKKGKNPHLCLILFDSIWPSNTCKQHCSRVTCAV